MQIDFKQIQETNALSCLECGKCTGACPVSRYSKSFSPRLILIRSIRNSHPDGLKSPDLWACLTCQRCETICPSDIKYNDFIQLVRNFVGIENREGTCSHGGILESISRIMTAENLKQQRMEWVTKEYQTSNKSDTIYFTGCLPYFDVLFSENGTQSLNIARSTLRILNYFDVKPQILANEKCCGHDFYWNGDLANFKKLAEHNIEQIKQSGAKKVVTSCPECYRTLKVDYPRYFDMPSLEVVHISEFLAERLQEKRPSLKANGMKVTFQDPCRLGRHLGIYEAPRQAIQHLFGSSFQEMTHHHKRSVCCGVTGWMNCSQVSKQIQAERLREAKDAGADTLITACAKCQIHFECALLDKKLKEEVNLEIKDLTEVFAQAIA